MSNKAESVFIEKSPALAGLRFRHVHDAGDAEVLFSVHAQCADHDQTDRLSSIEHAPTQADLARWIAQAAQERRTPDWLMAYIAEEIVGYSRIIWWTETDGLWVYLTTGWVVPSCRGRGIGTAMLHWAETRIQTLASEHPTNGQWEYASNATNTEVEATALLRDNGYYAAYTVLDMELTDFSRVPEPNLPQGLELRSLTSPHYRVVWNSIQTSYAKGRYAEDPTEERFRAYFEASEHDPALWQVAWDGEEVAGQVLCKIERGRGEVYEVSVRPNGDGAAWRAVCWLSDCVPCKRAASARFACIRFPSSRRRPRTCMAASAFMSVRRFPAIASQRIGTHQGRAAHNGRTPMARQLTGCCRSTLLQPSIAPAM